MMIGHLTIAGLAEMVVSGGVLAYLQRAEPGLLRASALNARDGANGQTGAAWRLTRPLWIALGVLLVLTPLGILAAGAAWGEWSPKDLSDPAARVQIEATSAEATLPENVPAGLERLSSFWTAPLPRYAPPYLKSESFGYIMSAMAGTGLIILATLLVSRLLGKASLRP
jgi:cobalt/nickel transport system permease protein